MKGFEIVESGRRMPVNTDVMTPTSIDQNTPTKGDKAMDMLSDNFSNILKLAGDIVEIRKMQVASDACLKKMEEDRNRILVEAQAYAERKRADTSSVVERMNLVRAMMLDFYAHNNGSMSGDDFCKIIKEVVNQMSRLEDGKC